MRKKVLLFIGIGLLINCTSENEDPEVFIEEETREVVNNRPVIENQSFSVEENAPVGTSVGQVKANDQDGDKIRFLSTSITGFDLDINTGELTVNKDNKLLDFESNPELLFEVTVSDGKLETTGEILLNISNVDDGPLTNFEKEVVDGFIWQILFDDLSFPLYKRTEKIKLFLDGSYGTNFGNLIDITTEQLNLLFTDGMEISIVDTQSDSNVHILVSTVAELSVIWPDFYDLALEFPGLGGIASQDRMWIADYAQNLRTIKHEMGHVIGLGHALPNQCNSGEDNSIMCGGVGKAGSDLTPLDKAIIGLYYHPEILDGLPGEEVEQKLTELILEGR